MIFSRDLPLALDTMQWTCVWGTLLLYAYNERVCDFALNEFDMIYGSGVHVYSG